MFVSLISMLILPFSFTANALNLRALLAATNELVVFFIAEPTPTLPPPCFIATAAYGTPLHEDIDVLSAFRAEHLMTNPGGRAFVKIYYTTSPPFADVISKNE